MFQQRAAQAYAQIGVETGVASSSPHGLILMLYDGAIKAIGDAAHCMAAKRVAEKGAALSKAISIIEQGLKGSLDTSRGGPMAVQLAELYDYMTRRLLMASIRHDVAILSEVQGLLGELREAWASIDAKTRAPHAAGTASTA
jgi:flagellar protein FliS